MSLHIIEELLAYDKIGEAIDILKDYYKKNDDEAYDDLIQLSGQFHNYHRRFKLDLPHDPKELNRIRFALLETIREINPEINIWVEVEVLKGKDMGNIFRLFSAIITIGRGEDNHISINDPRVSSLHGKIEAREHGIFYTHLSRSKPTFIRGKERGAKLQADKIQQFELQNEDIIVMGDTHIQVKLLAGVSPPKIASTQL